MKDINKVTERIKRNAAQGREPLRTIISQSQNAQVIEIAGLASMYLDYISECMTVIDCLTEMLQKPAEKRIFVVGGSSVPAVDIIRDIENASVVCMANDGKPFLPFTRSMPIVPLKPLEYAEISQSGKAKRRERRKRERKTGTV
jgi:hypothetical protein